MERSDEELAKQLWAIGDIARLRILRLLPHSPNCEHENNVSQLADKLGMPQPTISHHLKVLRQAGVISNKKMCRDVFYWIDRERSGQIDGALREVLNIGAEIREAEEVLASKEE